MRRDFISPFSLPPFPNMIRVGFGEDQFMYCEIYSDGRIEFFDDPLGAALLTLTPDNLEEVQFMLQHLKQCQASWEANRADREAADVGTDSNPLQEQTRLNLKPPSVDGQTLLAMPAAVIAQMDTSKMA